MITIYGRTSPICPFCTQARKMLEAAEIAFEYKDLSKDEWSIKEQEEKYGVVIRTIPFIVGECGVIGGAAELAKFLRG